MSGANTIKIPLCVNGVDILNVIELEPNAEDNNLDVEKQSELKSGAERLLPPENDIEKAEDLIVNENSSTKENSDHTDKAEKLVRLPVGRIKNLMKMDPDVKLATQEAVFLITKATELFIESLSKEAYNFTIKTKRKTVQRKDIDAVIDAVDNLVFLESVLDDLC